MRVNAHFFVLLVIILVGARSCSCEAIENENEKKSLVDGERTLEQTRGTTGETHSENGEKNPDLQKDEKRAQAARKRWKKAFEEIKSIVVDFTPENQKKGRALFDQWKLLLDGEGQGISSVGANGTALLQSTESTANNTIVDISDAKVGPRRERQRFDGFATWDKLLQQWADDIAGSSRANELESGSPIQVEVVEDKDMKNIRFSPRPAKAGETILPHTDIGDKSKKIWIVTTASLPWMTGTAVNPLLRAAYMTSGRKEAGGKVTLMLPWLEREADRDKLYGKDRSFDTSEEQEEWIRTWLRDTAGLKEPSEILNIAWYISRYETLENSIYSMGDIIATIPVRMRVIHSHTIITLAMILMLQFSRCAGRRCGHLRPGRARTS